MVIRSQFILTIWTVSIVFLICCLFYLFSNHVKQRIGIALGELCFFETSPKARSKAGRFAMEIPPWIEGRMMENFILHPRSLTVCSSKMDGWKTILAFWDGLFSGASC